MDGALEPHETIVRVPLPERHYRLILAPDGRFVGVDGGRFAVLADGDDRVIWADAGEGRYRHVATGKEVVTRPANGGTSVRLEADARVIGAEGDEAVSFTVAHGPEKLPSEYLETMRANGWVCLTSILAPSIVERLERAAGTDRYESEPRQPGSALSADAAVARTAAEPVSLWLIRAYMKTPDIRLAHTPGMAVLSTDDGERNVQGWHSDYPYHWGVPADGLVPTPTGETVLGVQRNVCVSDFTRERGATVFKLGSHARDHGPPTEWGTAALHAKPGYRAAHGLPYGGPEADIVEAPGGSIILYDARTWHRAGVNRTPHKRAAMLQAMTPMYVMPKNDTSADYRDFIASAAYGELTDRERDEMRRLMVHEFIGPGGRYAITADRELTELTRSTGSTTEGY